LKAGGAWASRQAAMFQYSSGLKAWRSLSRSTMSRSATDWTRPADKPREIFFHKRGLMR
jgi:hypothetical protein